MKELHAHQRPVRLAGVDIGTLTCRLLIAEVPLHGPLKEVFSARTILRLGEGVDRTRRLSEPAMSRVLTVLKEWKTLIDGYDVEACIAVATSAVRDADNRREFLDRVTQDTGFAVELLSGEEEARRTMLGIRSGLPTGITDVLALDIGGGSTEFILDRLGRAPITRSIDLGVVRLSERALHHDPPAADEIQRAREWIRNDTLASVADMPRSNSLTFVGTAGTITSLAAMAQRLPAYEPARIHNYVLKLEAIQDMEQSLLGMTKADRRGFPGLEKGREDVIAAGAVILRTVMETLDVRECLVSDFGLREGVLLHLAERHASLGSRPAAGSGLKD